MEQSATNDNRALFKNPTLWLGVVAAVLYSSWPLGYLLNPGVAHTALASQLEATRQPYNWLFIGCDIASGLALLAAGAIQWRRAHGWLLRLSIASYAAFAALVIVAALVPFDCDTPGATCVDPLHSPLIIIHGLASILSPAGLLISIALLLRRLLRGPASLKVRLLPLAVIISWGLLGLVAYDRYHHSGENLVQYGFISICSLSVLVAVTLIGVAA